MTGPITRRDALLRTAALASASLSVAPLTGIAAPLNKPAHTDEIDRALQARVSAREIPGVVAMAANQQSVVYEGAFGLRDMATASRMSADTVFRIASMVKLLTSVAALQLVERGKLKLDEPAGNIDPTLGSAQVLTGFDAKGVPQLRPAQTGLAAHAADVRAWLQVGLWRQSGPGWPDGGNRRRAEPRSLFQRSHHRTARHERHQLLAHRETARASGQPACEGGDWKASSAAPGKAECSESVFRRRRHLFHSAGLSDPAAGAVEWWKLSRDKNPSAGNRCLDVHKPDRQPRSGDPQDDKPGAIERRGFFSGRSAAMGVWTHDQYRSRPRRPQGRQPDMGRSVQYILLDRPDDADRRRDHDADPPLRRPASAQGLSTIRARDLPRAWVSLKIVHGRNHQTRRMG